MDTWCLAVKARFNMKKTEILLIGLPVPVFQAEMTTVYKGTGGWKNYPRNIRMASDGNVVRTLGAFIGNDMESVGIWSPTLAQISSSLERWQHSISTIEGQRHVVQMIIGGMTQFLTDVQSMPVGVCKCLDNMIMQYFWNNRVRPPVGMSYIQAPIDVGELKVLDLKARNKVIQVMWLKSYLDLSGACPVWAFLVDVIHVRTMTKDHLVRVKSLKSNPFLQRWRLKLSALPDMLQEMFKIGLKYGLRPEGLAFT